MAYDDLRTAISSSFSLSTLREITRLGHALLESDEPLPHPSAVYVVAATAQKLEWHLSGALDDDAASVIEAHIKPKIETILDLADNGGEPLLNALDDLARAYADVVRL